MNLKKSGNNYYTNHAKCGDTKGRLGVTNKGGYWLHHCFNCGDSWRSKVSFSAVKLDKAKSKVDNNKLVLPNDTEYNLHLFPVEYRTWLTRYGLTDAEIRRYSIGYSPRLGRLILPIFRDGELIAYQARSNTSQPKYLTYKHTTHEHIYFTTGSGDITVIVEDVISAIKVGSVAGVRAVAILGTRVTTHPIIAHKPKKVIVYLDYDNAAVKRTANLYKKTLDNLGVPVVIMRDGGDPKDLTINQLKDKLCPSH